MARPYSSGSPRMLVSLGGVRAPHPGGDTALLGQRSDPVPEWRSDLHIFGVWGAAWESVRARSLGLGARSMDLVVLGAGGAAWLLRDRLLLPPPSTANGRGRAGLARRDRRPRTVGRHGRIL